MKFLNIAYLTKTNIASLNGSEGSGGNITMIKKVKSFDGNEYVYVSGQALRRYLKETLRQMGNKISGVDNDGNPYLLELDKDIFTRAKEMGKIKGIKDKKKMFNEFIDLDLFGYMLPQGGRRWSAVKVAPLLSLYPFKGEYDYLTRKQNTENENQKSGNIVQVEIDTFNFMRGNVMVDLGAVGVDINEYTYGQEQLINDEDKKRRVESLIEAIKNFNGGAKQARNMEDISPKFLVGVKQKTGNPFLLNSLKIDEKGNVEIDLIIEEIKNYKDIIEIVSVGLTKGIFNNEEEIENKLKENDIHLLSVDKALELLKK